MGKQLEIFDDENYYKDLRIKYNNDETIKKLSYELTKILQISIPVIIVNFYTKEIKYDYDINTNLIINRIKKEIEDYTKNTYFNK